MRHRLIAGLFFLLIVNICWAQDYGYNYLAYDAQHLNPAAAGIDFPSTVSFRYQRQFAGTGAIDSRNAYLSFQQQLGDSPSGVGIKLGRRNVNFRNGYVNSAALQYRHQFTIAEELKISVGAELSYLRFKREFGLVIVGMSEPESVSHHPNFGLGVYLQYQEFSLGVSGLDILPDSDFDNETFFPFFNEITAFIKYDWRTGEKVVMTPLLLLTNSERVVLQMNTNFNDIVTLGLGAGRLEGRAIINLMFGLKLFKRILIIGNYQNLIFSNRINGFSPISFLKATELMVRYDFNIKKYQ